MVGRDLGRVEGAAFDGRVAALGGAGQDRRRLGDGGQHAGRLGVQFVAQVFAVAAVVRDEFVLLAQRLGDVLGLVGFVAVLARGVRLQLEQVVWQRRGFFLAGSAGADDPRRLALDGIGDALGVRLAGEAALLVHRVALGHLVARRERHAGNVELARDVVVVGLLVRLEGAGAAHH